MQKILAVIVAIVFVISIGFVTEARAGSSTTAKEAATGGAVVLATGGIIPTDVGAAIITGGLSSLFGSKKKDTTTSRYNTYVKDNNKIVKLNSQLSTLTPGSKQYNKVEKQITTLTTKINNLNPVVTGLGTYIKDTTKLSAAQTKLATGTLSAKQTAKLDKQISTLQTAIPKAQAKAVASEQKQYNQIQAKITTLNTKLSSGKLTQKQAAKVQNEINYNTGKATWLQSTVNSRLGL